MAEARDPERELDLWIRGHQFGHGNLLPQLWNPVLAEGQTNVFLFHAELK